MNDLGFENIEDILIEYKPSRDLKSEDVGQLAESRVHSKHGEAAFICYAAHKWNNMPTEVKSRSKSKCF